MADEEEERLLDLVIEEEEKAIAEDEKAVEKEEGARWWNQALVQLPVQSVAIQTINWREPAVPVPISARWPRPASEPPSYY